MAVTVRYRVSYRHEAEVTDLVDPGTGASVSACSIGLMMAADPKSDANKAAFIQVGGIPQINIAGVRETDLPGLKIGSFVDVTFAVVPSDDAPVAPAAGTVEEAA